MRTPSGFSLAIIGLALVAAGCSPGSSMRKETPAVNLTGVWTQTEPASKATFTLQLKGDALTGTVLRQGGLAAITNGLVKGDRVSFQTLHEASFPKETIITTTYTGTLNGDTITGKRAFNVDASDRGSTPWQIKRETVNP